MTRTIEVAAGHVSAIPPDEGRMLRVNGHLVAVFRLRDGGVRAMQPWCPHLGGPLADGLVGEGTVVCPLHGRTFDLGTGAARRGGVGVATFRARVADDGTIVVAVPAEGTLPCLSDDRAPPSAPEAGPAVAPFVQSLEEAGTGGR